MKSIFQKCLALLVVLIAAFSSQPGQSAGLLTPTESGLPQLAIREHHVNVVIEDGYAITTVEQVLANQNTTDLEAIYSFPVPEKAAVGEFTFWIDGKAVTGEVLEKEHAREIYELLQFFSRVSY